MYKLKTYIDKRQQKKLVDQVMNNGQYPRTLNFLKMAMLLEEMELETKSCIHQRKLNWFRLWIQKTNTRYNKGSRGYPTNWFIDELKNAKNYLTKISFKDFSV